LFQKHAISDPSVVGALALGLALLHFVQEPCPLGLRDGFLNNISSPF
jgi:hypothetical protein